MRKNNTRTTEKKQRRKLKARAKRARRVADRNARVDAQVARLTRLLERRDRQQKSLIQALKVGIAKLRKAVVAEATPPKPASEAAP